MSTAKELLAALRRKHAADAVVREVVIDDSYEYAIRRRQQLDQADMYGPGWASRLTERYQSRGEEVAPFVPDGWTLQGSIPQRRIDALIIASTGLTAVEIKVTRADFRRDTDAKRRAWQSITNRFVYLTPKGLVSPDEVADGCGLWEFDPDAAGSYSHQHGIKSVKRATVNKAPQPLPFQVTRALAYRVSRTEKETA